MKRLVLFTSALLALSGCTIQQPQTSTQCECSIECSIKPSKQVQQFSCVICTRTPCCKGYESFEFYLATKDSVNTISFTGYYFGIDSYISHAHYCWVYSELV